MNMQRANGGHSGNGSAPENLSEVMDYSSYDLRTTIRLIVMSGESRRISVKRGSKKGSIYIKHGEIYMAQTDESVGDEAFFEILAWDKAIHSDAPQDIPPESNMRISTQVFLDLIQK
jgi:hypothetical protein